MTLFHVSHRRARATGGIFSNDWFLGNQGQFEQHLAHLAGTPCRLLEIGCYEGQATTWLLTHIATHPESTITCVDLGEQPSFWANVTTSGREASIELLLGNSRDVLPALRSGFDFIYIDGAHSSAEVLQDAILAWRLARPGAIIAFDDYRWKDDQGYGGGTPKPAIDAFLRLYRQKLEILAKNYQVWIRKEIE